MTRSAGVAAAVGLIACLAVQPAVPAATAPPAQGPADRAAAPFDFDGDGYGDLTVGVPLEDVGARRDAGIVQVLYGSAAGPTARDQIWHQRRTGVKGRAERNDMFGEVLASADFDADGFADLAVGIPHEGVGGRPGAGAVQILYGGRGGLTARDRIWHQGSPGVAGVGEAADLFGSSLAAGDFDADGYPDLAVGVPGEGLAHRTAAGRVVVLRGSRSGLTATGATSLHLGKSGMVGDPRDDARFGAVLAAGDVTGDGTDDLVVAVPGAPQAGGSDGVLHLLRGGPSGLATDGSQAVDVASLGLAPDRISAVAVGDVDHDGADDVVMAVDGGQVAVLHGHGDGLHPAPLAAAAAAGIDGTWTIPHPGALAIADLTGDGPADLAVSSGTSLVVVAGSGDGLVPSATPWPFEGHLLGAHPLSGGRHAWLVIGKGWATVGGAANAGAVIAYQGTASGSGGTSSMWHQDIPGIKGSAEPGDFFGGVPG